MLWRQISPPSVTEHPKCCSEKNVTQQLLTSGLAGASLHNSSPGRSCFQGEESLTRSSRCVTYWELHPSPTGLICPICQALQGWGFQISRSAICENASLPSCWMTSDTSCSARCYNMTPNADRQQQTHWNITSSLLQGSSNIRDMLFMDLRRCKMVSKEYQ